MLITLWVVELYVHVRACSWVLQLSEYYIYLFTSTPLI